MTDTCTPPAGTKDGSWHRLTSAHAGEIKQLWRAGRFWDRDVKAGVRWPMTTGELAKNGWRYVGPIEPPETLQSIIAKLAADQQPLGADFEKVWDDNVAKLYEMEPAPPDARDALLREALPYVEASERAASAFGITGVDGKKLPSLAARIRANLKGE